MSAPMQEGTREVRLPRKEGIAVKGSTFVADQFGVITERDFKKGEIIFTVEGPLLDAPTRYSFAAGIDQHIEPVREDGISDFGHYLNHSCDPNVIVRPVHDAAVPRIDVIARRDISSGEELAFDYATLEYDVTVANAPCQCKSGSCRSVIHGYKDLPREVRDRYANEGIVAAYLVKLSEEEAA